MKKVKKLTVELIIPQQMPSGDACFVLGSLLKNSRIVIDERKGPSLTVTITRSSKKDVKEIAPQLKELHTTVKSYR